MLDISKMISEIQDTIIEKKINVFHVVVGILFALVPWFIANKRLTNEGLVNGLSILGYAIIVVHFGIILMYHFDKVKEMAEDDTTEPPTTGAPVSEEYDTEPTPYMMSEGYRNPTTTAKPKKQNDQNCVTNDECSSGCCGKRKRGWDDVCPEPSILGSRKNCIDKLSSSCCGL